MYHFKVTTTPPQQAKAISWQDFMATHPPGKVYDVSDAITRIYHDMTGHFIAVNDKDVYDYCDSKECKGHRFFKLVEMSNSWNALANIRLHTSSTEVAVYLCKNCNTFQRVYIFEIQTRSEISSRVLKIGQQPTFGLPIPSRAISLIGPDRELFLKGRQAESQGLGIAAFAYYRRIVENQWQRFLDEIIKVGNKTGLDSTTLQDIQNARKERQFDKAVKSMGEAIPPALKLNGHNPISLLYSALSEGIHAQTDEECLELASHIRVIIYELAERLSNALQEHNELGAAVKRLASRNNPPTKPDGGT